MESLKIKSHDATNSIVIYFESDRYILNQEFQDGGVNLTYDSSINQHSLHIKKDLFKESFKIRLQNHKGNRICFKNSITENLFSIYYEDNKETAKYYQKLKYIDYELGDKLIIKIAVKNIINFLLEESPRKISCKRYVLEESEKENLEFYHEHLEKFEKNYPEIKKSRESIKQMIKYFPVCSESIISQVINPLKGLIYLEIEQCIVNIEEMEKKELFFEPYVESENQDERAMENYVENYVFNRNNLGNVLTDEDIHKIDDLRPKEVKKIPAKLRRIRRLLIVQHNHSPPTKKVEINYNIEIIQKYEEEFAYVSKYNDKSDMLGKVLDLMDSVSHFSSGIPQVIISGITHFIKAIKTLKDMKDEYNRQKQRKHDEGQSIQTSEQINRSTRSVESIKREALRKAEWAIPGRKASEIIKFISNNKGYDRATYKEISHSIRIDVSESWVREVVQRLNRHVLQIYYGRPHSIDIFFLDDMEFWSRINKLFSGR